MNSSIPATAHPGAICKACGNHSKPYASSGAFTVYKCGRCGFGQTNVSPRDIDNFYEQAYFSGDSARFKQGSDDGVDERKKWWLDHYLDGARSNCLEIGPGPAGMVPRHLAATRSNMSYEAVEVSKAASEELQRHGFTVHTGRIYDADIAAHVRSRFDCVLATEVIEHDLDPGRFIEGLFNALKPGGVACLTTGNFDGWMARIMGGSWYYIDPPAHVVFYTPRSARRLFKAAGFAKVDVQCIGLSYIGLYQRFALPGLLPLVDLLQISTGMTIRAFRD